MITVSLTEYPTIVKSAAIVEIPNSMCIILMNAIERMRSWTIVVIAPRL